MNRIQMNLGLLAILTGCAQAEKNDHYAGEHPNIIFILADDLGYGDISILNKDSKIKTPHVDALARKGVIFTDAHSSAAVSTPTRYGVLTGRYNWRSRLKQGVLVPYDTPLIETGRTTMASMLRAKGYQTAAIGKWHLGMLFATVDGKPPVDREGHCNVDFAKPITNGPLDYGFDYYFGMDVPNYPPYCYIENRQLLGMPTQFYPTNPSMDSRPGRGLPDWDMTKVLPDMQTKTIEKIEEMARKGDPFFMYVPLMSPHTPIVPTDEFEGKSGLNLYADFVIQTDAYVGAVTQKLQELGIEENTIVVFTSDNGCSPKAEYLVLLEKGHNPSYIYRGTKADLFEGGHRVPCVVSWPSVAKPHIVDQTICLTDFMRTFAHIVGHTVMDNEAEDSYNIYPLLADVDHKETIRKAIVHHSVNGEFAVRRGDWKLLLSSSSGGWSNPRPNSDEAKKSPPVQLYNVKEDPSEQNNLQAERPELVNELTALITKHIKEGRSTAGTSQKNNGKYPWRQLGWMKEE